MAHYTAVIHWQRNSAIFTDNRYSRGHHWQFDGGIDVPASSSPNVVPLPYSVVAAVDPEEAFVASLSSCHMLWFLSIAAKRGFVVEQYRDSAIGSMKPDADGKLAMAEVVLQPTVTFHASHAPDTEMHYRLHHAAHDECFLARSVKTIVRCEPVLRTMGPDELSTHNQPSH